MMVGQFTSIALGVLLAVGVYGEEVNLQPGKAYEFSIRGYPRVKRGEAGQEEWTFQTTPGSRIMTYCNDFRMYPSDMDPCESFQMTITSGSTVKTFCRNGEIVNFKSSGSTMKVEMKYAVGGLASCVARSTVEPPAEEVVLDGLDPKHFAEPPAEFTPYFDKLWIVKSAKGEKVTVDCSVNMNKDEPCFREFLWIDNGKETIDICEQTEAKVSSDNGPIKVRAVFGPYAAMYFSCHAFTGEERDPQSYYPDPSQTKKPLPPPETFNLNPGNAIAFDNLEFRDAGKHTYTFNTVEGATIRIACDEFYQRHKELDPCTDLNITLNDGVRATKFCIDKRFLFYQSKGSSVTMEVNYAHDNVLKCTARTSAVKNMKEITLTRDDGIFSFNHPETRIPWYDAGWTFTSEEGKRVSLQCDISTESYDDGHVCLQEVITVDNGDKAKVFCGANKLVLFSKERTIKILVQLNSYGSGAFYCKAQAVSGSDPDEINNLRIEESAEDAGEGKGKKGTTCTCGARNHDAQRIFHGKKTKESEYPWMVGIRDSGNFQRCGGSIITQYHILTAAHCMTDSKVRNKDDLWETVIYVGAHNLFNDASHRKTKGYEVKETFIPEEWWQWKRGYDLAVLVLKEKIEFGKFVSPVCLTNVGPRITYKSIKAIGWGRTEQGGAAPDLLSTHLFVLHRSQCGDSDVIVCTNNKYSSVCYGDSGGPLAYVDPKTNRYTQVGVASYVNYPYCESSSGYSNVTFHFDYINDIVKRTEPNARICMRAD